MIAYFEKAPGHNSRGLMKIRLDILHGRTEGNGTLKTQWQPFQINRASPQSPMHGSLGYFPQDPVEEHNFYSQYKDHGEFSPNIMLSSSQDK